MFMYKKNIFEKKLLEACSPHLYASFGTFCVQIVQLFAAQWVFQQSEEFEIDDILLWWQWLVDFQTVLQRLTVSWTINQFGRKRCQKSVKMRTRNFYKSFFKNVLLYMNGQLSKIPSVHMYVLPRTVYFDWICIFLSPAQNSQVRFLSWPFITILDMVRIVLNPACQTIFLCAQKLFKLCTHTPAMI